MKNPIELISKFRVCDVMRGDVVTLRTDQTMSHAASVLHSYGVTGAPVVDEEGQCVGVLSATDFVDRETTASSIPALAALAFDSMYIKKTFSPPESIESNIVKAYMTTDVITADANTPLIKAARMLCEERIHRLIVVDEQNRPLGVVSSLDIVASMVVAIEE